MLLTLVVGCLSNNPKISFESSNIGISGKVDVDFCQVSDLENMLGIEIDNPAQSQNSDKSVFLSLPPAIRVTVLFYKSK